MHTRITRAAIATGAAAALSALGVTGVSAAGAAAGGPRQPRTSSAGVAAAAAVPGAQIWVKRYNGPGNGADEAQSMAVAPGGTKVFVTGASEGTTTGTDYATIGYSTSTGAQLWIARYNGQANGGDRANSVAVSPDGSKVFVTGGSDGTTTGTDYATVAYSAATGARLWVARYNGPANKDDGARSVAVSPDGATVFVTGFSQTSKPSPEHEGDFYSDYATVAYNAATGARLWVKRYDGPGGLEDRASALAAAPNGTKVFVTGLSGPVYQPDYATVAYSAATGAQLWVKRYNGPANDADLAASVVTPGNGTAYVTGTSDAGRAYATIAYRMSTGGQLWVKRYNGPANSTNWASSLAASPGGTRIFVTGESTVSGTGSYATVAYNAATGAQLWSKRYNGNGGATSVAVARDGIKVFVTGGSYSATGADYATVAYHTATGAQLWVKRYNGPGSGDDTARSAVTSPTSGRVFVTGDSGPSYVPDYATIAYSG